MGIEHHTIEEVYCDHCGDLCGTTGHPENPRTTVSVKGYKTYASLPWSINSANKGESGIVCVDCDRELQEEELE